MGLRTRLTACRRLRIRWMGLALAALACLALPPAAGARTKTVQIGPFGKPAQRDYQKAFADANAYFRRSVSIHKGDRVRWEFNGFHSVTFVPQGEQRPGLAAPDVANLLSGVNDAAGSPFWFNGQPRLLLNPLSAFPQGGGSFDPDELTSSGLPLDDGPPQPYKLRFKRTGSFAYFCVVHPGMKGQVRVVRRGQDIPTARQDRRAAKRERGTLLRQAQRLTTGLGTGPLENIMQAGNDNRAGVAAFRFFPKSPSYRVGDTATLRMSPRSTDVHTFTFGPSNGKDLYVDQIVANFVMPAPGGGGGPPTLLFDPRAGYPSENPAAGVPAHSAGLHGNGFFNSGLLDTDPDTPLPSSTSVRFTQAGTFSFICVIHPFMSGTVTVAP